MVLLKNYELLLIWEWDFVKSFLLLLCLENKLITAWKKELTIATKTLTLNVSTDCLNCCPMLWLIRENMSRQILHVCVVSEIQEI